MSANPKFRMPRAFGALSTVMKDNLYALRDGRHIYTSPWVNEGPLRRCSASIGLTATRAPFELTVGGSTQTYQAGAIRPMVERVLRAENVGVIGFQFDPSHPAFPRFRRIPAPGVLPIDRNLFSEFDEQLDAAYRGELTTDEASALFDSVTSVALASFPKAKPVDKRVEQVMALLWENHNYQLSELAAAVGVSYYRLSHLFAENIGMPLRSYQQWRKVRKAISLSKHGYTLTKIAHDAGFTDSAHLCRTFQHLHAAPPSYFFNSGNVNIVSPPVDATSNAVEVIASAETASTPCADQQGR